jgi:hypothetical protein
VIGAAIVFDLISPQATNNLPMSNANSMAAQIVELRGENRVNTNDVYWYVPTGKVFQYSGTPVTNTGTNVNFNELTSGGFLSATSLIFSTTSGNGVVLNGDGMAVFSGGSKRVVVGNLSGTFSAP